MNQADRIKSADLIIYSPGISIHLYYNITNNLGKLISDNKDAKAITNIGADYENPVYSV